MSRIIAGAWRGRMLPVVAPGRAGIRPTPGRAREALFSLLDSRFGFDWSGIHVADLCAGSGALGLEALSRGAAHAAFVERDRAALARIRAALAEWGGLARAELLGCDVRTLPTRREPVALLLFDGPYAEALEASVLPHARAQGWIGADTLCVLDLPASRAFAVPGFVETDRRRFGQASLCLAMCA